MTSVTTYSDDALERMLADVESDLVERKRSAGDRSSIRRTICAFANDLPGHRRAGIIFVGAEDDGRCSGIVVNDDLLTMLAQMRTAGNILPLPVLVVQKRVLGGCELVVVMVMPSDSPPVRYEGRVWVKVGPTVQMATPEEERRLAERRRSADLNFDLRPAPSASSDDLDLDYFRSEYLPQAVAPEVLEQNRRSAHQQLESLRLTMAGVPVYGGLLALGRDPQRWVPGAWIQFLRIDGETLADPIVDQKELTGRLEDVLRRVDELLTINIAVRVDLTSQPREVRQPNYPIVALQQIVRNAIMHRSYDGTNAPTRISWFTDRVEVQSPGGLYGRVTPQNFGRGATDYRNPLVAEIMHHLGFAQRFGFGVILTRQELEKNGNPPPEFSFEESAVGVIVRVAP